MLFEGSCCPTDQIIHVSAAPALDQQLSGPYNWKENVLGGKPIYARQDGKYCLMFYNHWKVETCDHHDKVNAVGFIRAPPNVQPGCSNEVGENWMYYGVDVANPDIKIQCKGKEGSFAHFHLFKSSSMMVVFKIKFLKIFQQMLQSKCFRISSNFTHLQLRSSSMEVLLHRGCLPRRSFSMEVVFYLCCLHNYNILKMI